MWMGGGDPCGRSRLPRSKICQKVHGHIGQLSPFIANLDVVIRAIVCYYTLHSERNCLFKSRQHVSSSSFSIFKVNLYLYLALVTVSTKRPLLFTSLYAFRVLQFKC